MVIFKMSKKNYSFFLKKGKKNNISLQLNKSRIENVYLITNNYFNIVLQTLK